MASDAGTFERAIALAKSGQRQAALDAFAAIPADDPHYGTAQFNLGVMARGLGLMERATEAYRTAARIDPSSALAWMGLAQTLSALDRFDHAADACEKVIGIEPDNATAWLRLSDNRRFQGRHADAVAAAEKAAALQPDSDRIQGTLLYGKMRACAWDNIDALRTKVGNLVRRPDPAPMLRPFMGVVALKDPAAQKAVADAEAARICADAPPLPPAAPRTDPRIAVGYLSAGFRDHPTGHLTKALFAAHNPKAVRVVGLSLTPDDGGDLRHRIAAGCETMVDLSGLSDEDAAHVIRDQGLDVMVDLHGFLQGHRARLAAMRPAPVVVNWLGFPGTTGAGLHDYILVDDIIAPAGTDAHFAEAVVRLGGGYQVNDPGDFVPERADRGPLGLGDGPVFCCFNMSYKIDPNAFDAWAEILHAVSDAQLWLLDMNAEVAANLTAEAKARGIAGRLVFGPPLKRAAHIRRLTAADIALDPWICGGHTSTTDCLFAGVPVVTLPGDSFAGRVAASLMTHAGLPDCVAPDRAGYIATAVDLARNPDRRAAIRTHLTQNGAQQPLFDVAARARVLEAAYRAMATRHRAGHDPAPFTVTLNKG